MHDWTKLEKATLTGLASIALLTFFLPLLVIQAPIVGEQDVSGYDIFSRVRQFSRQVDNSSAQPESQPKDPQRTPEADMPLSLRLAWLIPVNVTAAFLFAIATYIGANWRVRVSLTSAVLGAVVAVFAALHIAIANSDLHSWIAASIKSSNDDLKGNPFAAMAEQFGNLMLNAFRI